MTQLELASEPVTGVAVQALLYCASEELERRYGQGADQEHLCNDELAPPYGAFVVARLATHLAGGVGLRPIGPEPGVYGEIKRLWVRPDLRRSGVGVALMETIEREALRIGYRKIFLETGERQPEAVAFYERLGWQHIDAYPPGSFGYPEGIKFSRML
jgi:GNAT superfamily N-acetyltransferase